MLNELKKDYAELVIRAGLNIQENQRVLITAPVEGADFARMCARAAYDAGAREVIVRWRDDELTRMKYLHAADEIFDTVNPWEADMLDILSEEGAGFLSIYAEDPESLAGVDPGRIRRAQIASGRALEKYRARQMKNECPWCVCSIPTAAWAKAVFPDMDEDAAMEKLWGEILAACRVGTAAGKAGNSAVESWRAHSDELQKHVRILNEYNFKTLRYKNAAGTDVCVELPEGHYWAGGEEASTAGIMFSANIPTEEVFTLPKRDGINGRLVATKPLSHNGTLIDGFWFEVKDGKIVDLHADKGEEILRDAISVDEGASYFGEVALVPHDSPISNSGILFFNTLFDENASCHFAFGEAYPCIKGSEDMTEEELKERGVNFSMTHVDFMVGSADLEITGITHEGEEVAVFRNGNFVF